MANSVIIKKAGHIATLILNRPDTRNALDSEVIDGIENACAGLNANIDVRVAILSGAGPSFSSGGNIKDMQNKKGLFGGTPMRMRHNYRTGIQRIPRALKSLDVPIIAAVNGPAIGAGLDLACMCDIRLASDTAKFASSFAKVGIIPGDGGAWLLPRVIGNARAAEMIFSGDVIDSATAEKYGLVSRVVPAEDLMEQAEALAQRVACNPPHVLRMAKSLMRESDSLSLESLLEMSAAYQAIIQHTEDHREAVRAMTSREKPDFSGNF